jgi:hypothetical protein
MRNCVKSGKPKHGLKKPKEEGQAVWPPSLVAELCKHIGGTGKATTGAGKDRNRHDHNASHAP